MRLKDEISDSGVNPESGNSGSNSKHGILAGSNPR
jgi:hypothetical protein